MRHMPKSVRTSPLRRVRDARGWSRVTLSEKSGVGTTTIAQIELYGRSARTDTLRALARALDVPVGTLLEMEDAA